MTDIFEFMKEIDSCNIDHYKNMPEEERKKIFLYLIQRWMTGTYDEKQILLINQFVNTKVFSLYKHPDLIYKLLCASSTGKKRYKWEGRKKKNAVTSLIEFLCEFYECSRQDAEQYATILDSEAILDMARDFGADKERISKIKKDLKNVTNND